MKLERKGKKIKIHLNVLLKKVIPFNTHAGYGVGSGFDTVKSLCKDCDVRRGISIEGGKEKQGRLLVIQKDYAKQVKELTDYFNESQSYTKGSNDEPHLPFKAMTGLFNGSKHLYINADDEKSITDAVNFAKSQGVSKITIVGGYQAGNITDFLKQNNVSIFLGIFSDHSIPTCDIDTQNNGYWDPI